MEALPIGVMKMKDQGEGDDKIIAVHANDPEVSHIRSIKELSPHRMKEIRRFFEDYKLLENKSVEIADVLDREAALSVIRDSLALYKKERPRLVKDLKS
jgi:inorganic pyrophosphatase